MEKIPIEQEMKFLAKELPALLHSEEIAMQRAMELRDLRFIKEQRLRDLEVQLLKKAKERRGI